MLTIFFGFIFLDHVSYTFTKFSDFWYNGFMDKKYENLSVKIFSDLCCSNCTCQTESQPMPITDNMGREVFWEDLGRPNG